MTSTQEPTKCSKNDQPKPVSIMYTRQSESSGHIYPLVDGFVVEVESIGFHCGRVLAVGSKSKVEVAMKNNCGFDEYDEQVLCGEQTLLPGFIEPHVHIVPTAAILKKPWNDFSPFKSDQYLREDYGIGWLGDKIGEAKEKLAGDEELWILGHGVDNSLMPLPPQTIDEKVQLQSLSWKDLDKIESTNPLLMVSASLHTGYVNSCAVKKIYKCNKEELKEKGFHNVVAFLKYVKDNEGLQELEELEMAINAIPKDQLPSDAELLDNLHELFANANKRGVTLMYDAGMTDEAKDILGCYLDSRELLVRIGYAMLCETLDGAKNMKPCETLPNNPYPEKAYQGSVKLISDGSNQGLTGYQGEEYCCKAPHEYGIFNFIPSVFDEILTELVKKECPVMVHANGNEAVDLVIKSYQKALRGKPGTDQRHRIEHCSLLDDSSLNAMSEIGVSPSFLIGHVGYWGYAFKFAIFQQKAEELDRCKSALDKGLKITLHTDNDVTPIGPLRLMEQAITRIMEQAPEKDDDPNKVLNQKEKLTPQEALKAVTYDAAWQCHADQFVGSLEPPYDRYSTLEKAKFADYVILKENPITRGTKQPIGMRNIKVLETWVGGVKVYDYKKDDLIP